QTAASFVWPVNPPATAMFMGAGYLGTSVTLLGALAMARSWGQVSLLIGPVVVFAALMLSATGLHAGRFFWDRPQTWLWVTLYGVILAGAGWLALSPPPDPPGAFRQARLTGLERLGLGTAGASMAVATGALFLAPELASPAWPWPLTPLTARVVAAWIAVGATLSLAAALRGNSVSVRIPLIGWTITVLLFELAALIGLPADVLNEPVARLYLVVLGTSVLGSIWLPPRWDLAHLRLGVPNDPRDRPAVTRGKSPTSPRRTHL
ncbi:MAG: hypothetical protein HYU75_04475, partial [Betaproteobacteria bacterium]|nr:hypothetical protein [Betaproteobacteria bacterium]